VLAVQQRVLGYKHPDTLGTVNNLAIVLKSQGKSAEAEKMCLQFFSRCSGPSTRTH
jgi:hypothetical protein